MIPAYWSITTKVLFCFRSFPNTKRHHFFENIVGVILRGTHMDDASQNEIADSSPIVQVDADTDRFGEHRGLGVSTIDFKLSAKDTSSLFTIENKFWEKGGPAKHLHYEQDEWFYILEGEFTFEVGQEQRSLRLGDSLFAPRKVPHVWAFVGDSTGRLLITFTPAGQMEAFFREVTKTNAMPLREPALWRAYGMELLGPPLPVT